MATPTLNVNYGQYDSNGNLLSSLQFTSATMWTMNTNPATNQPYPLNTGVLYVNVTAVSPADAQYDCGWAIFGTTASGYSIDSGASAECILGPDTYGNYCINFNNITYDPQPNPNPIFDFYVYRINTTSTLIYALFEVVAGVTPIPGQTDVILNPQSIKHY